MKLFRGIHADFMGIIASTACAIHCSVLPILLAMGSLTTLSWMQEEWVEICFLLTAIVLSIWSIIPNFIRNKSNYLALVWMLIGLVFLSVSMVNHHHDGGVQIYSVIGGVALSIAHLINYKYQVQCTLTNPV